MANLNLALIYLLMPVLIWVVLARLRSPVVALWCLGSLLGAASLVLTLAFKFIPIWIYAPVVSLLDFSSLLCTIQSLRLDRGRPWRLRWMLAAGLGFLVLFEVCRNTYLLGTARMAFVPLVELVLVLEVVRWAWRIGRPHKSLGAMTIVASHLVLAVGMLLVLVELFHPTGGGLVCPRDSSGLTDVLGLVAAIGGDMGFIGIALERSLHQWLKAADTQARTEERLLLGNQLAHLERQRGFGLVAASLAHELNQPLTAILASAQAARRGAEGNRLEPAQSLDLLDKVILNTRRISSITERIRSFIRAEEPHRGTVDLEQVGREMLELLEPDLRRQRIQVTFPPPAGPILVQGDVIQLSQVVLNVLRNAIEAVQQVEERTIQIQLTRSDEEALLSIRDTGPGIELGLSNQVGTPYFTTKQQGLGMGLSISIAILQQHQGGLTICNAEGGGAWVDIWLPLVATEGGQA